MGSDRTTRGSSSLSASCRCPVSDSGGSGPRHDVKARAGMPTSLPHAQVGDLTLSREKLAIGGAEGQLLVIYHAEPGTSSAEKLALLASLASPAAADARQAIRGPVPQPDGPLSGRRR